MEYKCSNCGKVEEFESDQVAEQAGWLILRQEILKDLIYCRSCKSM